MIDIAYYIVLFNALYILVFFLIVFLENKAEVADNQKTEIDLEGLPSITFIIPCWNEENGIQKTVASALSSNYPAQKLKVILIDDGSTDNTWKKMKFFRKNPQVLLIKQNENKGKALSLNNALKMVTTDLVATFDADTSIEKDGLLNASNMFLKNKNLTAISGTVLIDSPKSLAQKAQSIEYQTFSFTKKMLGLIGGVLVAPGAFTLYKTSILKDVGGFRPAHKLEDMELTFRLHSLGYVVDHNHTTIVRTTGPKTLKALFKQRVRWSHGFIGNLIDYRHMLFKRKFGHFSFFTLPITTFGFFTILFIFSVGLYRLTLYAYEKYNIAKAVGLTNSFSLGLDYFFIDSRVIVFISLVVFGFMITTYFLGTQRSTERGIRVWNIILYIVIYSLLAPLWVAKSVYNWITGGSSVWR